MLKGSLKNLVNSEVDVLNNKDNAKCVFKGYFTNPDYSKLENNNNYTSEDIKDIFDYIDSTLKHKRDVGAKFERNAQEIISSGSYNGCSDFAIVFEDYARQKGIPTVHLVTSSINWIKDLNNNIPTNGYIGHHFCECYISNKWILVDPINKKIHENYDKDNFIINPDERTNYYVYAKCHTIDELIPSMKELIPEQPNMIKYHNKLMKTLFTNFDLNKLSKSTQEDIER